MTTEQKLREALQAIASIADKYAGDYPTQVGAIARQALALPTTEPSDGDAVAAQSRFVNESKWEWCTIAHHHYVQSDPADWPGYETRLLYPSQPASKPKESLVVDGWKFVPVEPTRQMLTAALRECGGIGGGSCGEHTGVDGEEFSFVWSTMLSAAPDTKPTTQAQEPCQHQLYKTEDADKPAAICDRNGEVVLPDLLHLVRVAVETEREACAKVCETKLGPTATGFYGNTYAAAIRARGAA